MYVQLRGNVSRNCSFGRYIRTCIVVYAVFTLCIGVRFPSIFSLVEKSHFVTCLNLLKILFMTNLNTSLVLDTQNNNK
jgi:hypothetical protein